MFFIILGVVLVLLKVADFGPVGSLSWWWVLLPFVLASIWWTWADKSGLTKRRAMNKIDAKREERRRKAMEALGTGTKRKR